MAASRKSCVDSEEGKQRSVGEDAVGLCGVVGLLLEIEELHGGVEAGVDGVFVGGGMRGVEEVFAVEDAAAFVEEVRDVESLDDEGGGVGDAGADRAELEWGRDGGVERV